MAWPLVRYDPVTRAFLLDSPRPRLPLAAYTAQELRFRVLVRTNPEAAGQLAVRAEEEVRQRWQPTRKWRRADRDGSRGGRERVMDPTTRYLGLELANPWSRRRDR